MFKHFKHVFSFFMVLAISLLYITNSFASTFGSATSSDASRVLGGQVGVASSSDAFPSQDYMETDGFDTLDMPVLMSSGDVSNTVNLTGCWVEFSYYDMSNKVHVVSGSLNKDGYSSIGTQSDFSRPYLLSFAIGKSALPVSSGKYNMQIHFGSNTGITYRSGSTVEIYYSSANTSRQQSITTITPTFSSGDIYYSSVVDLGTTDYIYFRFPLASTVTPPVGGYWSVNFTKTNAASNIAGPNAGVDMSGEQIADNTAQQVAQGDTIIELIKNTIQTISSQLTAFWNQLAGEFTNLYNKMTAQHSEQLQADRDNTDNIIAADDANTSKVTTAIESHGNFIIEGLKKLFIPSDEYFKAYFDDLYGWFSERFGFLSFPIDLLLEVIDIFVNSSQTDCVLVLPSFTIMDNLLWPEMSFNLTEFLDTNFSFVVVAIKTVTSIYLVMAFVQLCEEKWNEVMMN